MFIIHKNGKNTSILTILKSNSTSFMFCIFFLRILKKVTLWGPGEMGNLHNCLLELILLVFTNIQAISTLVCLRLDDNGFAICNYSIFYNTRLNKPHS